ncbi:SAM_2 domain-containing protein [Gossypium australe]|uniref:SAM_2 domain-containing protein n=1 Tax=Gossypium australe TaxID=47621 RepID=A0A5B6UPY5_9ROSI|nr:SAM_2 domain-containing protein [Gossypium australe]
MKERKKEKGKFFSRLRISKVGILDSPLYKVPIQDVGMWLEEINLGSYRQIFKENGVNGEYLEGMSMFTTEQILQFIRRCHMKWGDFITLCKELRRIKVACLKGEQKVRRPWWAPSCLSLVFLKVAKRNRQSRVVSLKLEP